MTLRARLLISYAIAIAAFCLTFAGCIFLFYPLTGHPPSEEMAEELPPPPARTLAMTYAHGGMAEVEASLRKPGLYFPNDAWITLHRLDGTSAAVIGDEVIGSPEDVKRALEGRGRFHRSLFTQGFSLTAPVRALDGSVVAALSVEFGYTITPMRQSLARRRVATVALAVAAGLLLCVWLSIKFSTAVASPVVRLVGAIKRMGPRDLDLRVPVEGPLEMVELSTSFNRLAEELEHAMAELRQQKELAQRMEGSRREFLADVSHNLRTPLTAIQGWLDALRDGLVSAEDTPRQLDRLQREVGHVIRTVQHLLDLARWESEEPRLVMETFPVLDAVMEVAETLEEPASAAEVSLQFDDVSSTWNVHADRGKVREIFQILFENAVKYAGPGTTVHLSMAPRGDRLEVLVRDDGEGIAPDVLPHLRERYHRASSGGIGLGLAIVYKLVRAHGGEVEIESHNGTRVEFTLPLAVTGTRT